MEKSRGFTFADVVIGVAPFLVIVVMIVAMAAVAIKREDRGAASSALLSMECVHGVAYVRTTGSAGGITVAYNPDGSIKLCEGEKK